MTTVKKLGVEISGLIRSSNMKHMKILWKYFWQEASIWQQFDTHFHCLSGFLAKSRRPLWAALYYLFVWTSVLKYRFEWTKDETNAKTIVRDQSLFTVVIFTVKTQTSRFHIRGYCKTANLKNCLIEVPRMRAWHLHQVYSQRSYSHPFLIECKYRKKAKGCQELCLYM